MIFYIVTDIEKAYREGSVWFNIMHTLESHAEDVCLIVHYKKVSPKLVSQLQPWAICHSGGSTSYSKYDVLESRNYRRVVRSYRGAQIGLCGGHQILAVFHGGAIGEMRKLKDDEPNLAGYAPGQYKEWGVYPVQIVRRDPLFNGLGPVIRVQEYHSWEVKKLGRELELLASNKDCRVQAYVHRRKPLYGTQFHPEQSSPLYPDGFKILKNFFRLARAHWKRR